MLRTPGSDLWVPANHVVTDAVIQLLVSSKGMLTVPQLLGAGPRGRGRPWQAAHTQAGAQQKVGERDAGGKGKHVLKGKHGRMGQACAGRETWDCDAQNVCRLPMFPPLLYFLGACTHGTSTYCRGNAGGHGKQKEGKIVAGRRLRTRRSERGYEANTGWKANWKKEWMLIGGGNGGAANYFSASCDETCLHFEDGSL
eukprot:1137800-Pelagomonas_calceolata.AAC.5